MATRRENLFNNSLEDEARRRLVPPLPASRVTGGVRDRIADANFAPRVRPENVRIIPEAAPETAPESRPQVEKNKPETSPAYSAALDYITNAQRGTATTPFTYESAPEYVSRFKAQIDGLTQDILNRPAFSYDLENDPMWAIYEDMYTRGGQRAMEDTLAQLSARTGGLASSYAGQMAQQTYQDYMDELSGIAPELRNAAYDMYLSEGDAMRDELDILTALEAQDYGRYLDDVDAWDNERQFAYDAWNDEQNRAADWNQALLDAAAAADRGNFSFEDVVTQMLDADSPEAAYDILRGMGLDEDDMDTAMEFYEDRLESNADNRDAAIEGIRNAYSAAEQIDLINAAVDSGALTEEDAVALYEELGLGDADALREQAMEAYGGNLPTEEEFYARQGQGRGMEFDSYEEFLQWFIDRYTGG